MTTEPGSPFRNAFPRAAGRVRRALAATSALDGASWGGVIGAGVALGLHYVRLPHGTLWGTLATLLGALVALSLAARRRFTDTDVALFLDARLGGEEAITTALEGRAEPVVLERAERALSRPEAASARPRVVRPLHGAIPLALVVLAVTRYAPQRADRPSPMPAEAKTIARLDGLRRVEALRDLSTEDDVEKKRLAALAEAAKKLQDKARAGIDRRQALDSLEKLSDGVDAERNRLADGRNRAGLEAATRALRNHPELSRAAAALGEADLLALDRELQRVADASEARARQAAREALDAATEAARAKGAEDVARALGEQRRLLERRGATSAAMRELSRLLGDRLDRNARRRLERLDRGDAAATEALAEAFAEAVRSLSEEERRKLAEALAKSASAAQGEESLTKKELARLAKELSTDEGRKRLRESLKQMVGEGASERAAAARALALAMAGIGSSRRELGGAGANGDPGDGPGGPGTHEGRTPTVAGSSLPALAHAPAQGGIPLGPAPGLSPALPATSALPTPAAIGAAAPREVSGVERSNVPREYREQVGKYFGHE